MSASPYPKLITAKSGRRLALFFEHNYAFSNFYACAFSVDGNDYFSSEQYFMHQKALVFGDEHAASKIMQTTSPSQAKKFGRQVKNFDSASWDVKRQSVMLNGLRAKFSQNEDLKKILLSTDDALIAEASPRDKIWGIGLGISNAKVADSDAWPGRNLLGLLLMSVREELKAQVESSKTKTNLQKDF